MPPFWIRYSSKRKFIPRVRCFVWRKWRAKGVEYEIREGVPPGRKLGRITTLPRQGWHRCQAFVSVFATGVCVIPRIENRRGPRPPLCCTRDQRFRTHLTDHLRSYSLRGSPRNVNARTHARTHAGNCDTRTWWGWIPIKIPDGVRRMFPAVWFRECIYICVCVYVFMLDNV